MTTPIARVLVKAGHFMGATWREEQARDLPDGEYDLYLAQVAPACPNCGSRNFQQLHQCTPSLGDVDFKECDDCGYQWDHT